MTYEEIRECYAVLGLPMGASQEAIERAFRTHAKAWHPDRFTRDPAMRAEAERQMKRINEARDRLHQFHANGGQIPNDVSREATKQPEPDLHDVVDTVASAVVGVVVLAIRLVVGIAKMATVLTIGVVAFLVPKFRSFWQAVPALAGKAFIILLIVAGSKAAWLYLSDALNHTSHKPQARVASQQFISGAISTQSQPSVSTGRLPQATKQAVPAPTAGSVSTRSTQIDSATRRKTDRIASHEHTQLVRKFQADSHRKPSKVETQSATVAAATSSKTDVLSSDQISAMRGQVPQFQTVLATTLPPEQVSTLSKVFRVPAESLHSLGWGVSMAPEGHPLWESTWFTIRYGSPSQLATASVQVSKTGQVLHRTIQQIPTDMH